MINNTESKKVYEVQSGVTEYPIGFPFHFNADQTPQLSVVIGHDVLQLNYNCKLSEDKGMLILIPTEEEAEELIGPDDYSWMDKWVGAHLVIERDIPFVQESDYQLGRISAEQIEHDFDASVMRDQMLAEEIGKHTVDVQGEIDALHSRIDFVQEEHLLDMANVDASLATKATKTELVNTGVVLSQGIEAQAQAIQKTRDDYQAADQNIRADMNAKDSELETILNDHAERLNTLRTDHDDLGDDVSEIQAKIPESASDSNPLVTKQQLLDEEMDIREDLNEGLSELQTQITEQAAAITNKQDKLTAGNNITIENNVISATGGGGGSGGEGGGLDKAYTKLMVHVPTQEEFDNGEVQQGSLGYTFALPDGLEDGEYYFYITVLDRPSVTSTDEYPNYSSPINNYKDFIVDFAMGNGRVRFCSVRCGERTWFDFYHWNNGLDTDLNCFNVYTCNGRQVFFTRHRFVEGGLFEQNGWSGRTDTDVAAVTFSKVVNRNTKEEFVIENDEYMHYFHGYGSKNPSDFGWEESWPYSVYSIAPQSGLKDYILQDVSNSFSTLTNVYTPSDYGGYMIGIANLLRDNNSFDINIGDKIKIWINNAYNPEAWVIFEIDVLNKTYTKKIINGGIDGDFNGVNNFKVGIASNDWRRQVVFYRGDVSEMIGFGEHQVYYQIQPNFFINNIYFDFWWEDEYVNYDGVEVFEFLTPVTSTDLEIISGEITRIDNQVGDISNVLDIINGEDV